MCSTSCATLSKGAATSEDPQSMMFGSLPHMRSAQVLRLLLEHTRSTCHAMGVLHDRAVQHASPLDICSKTLVLKDIMHGYCALSAPFPLAHTALPGILVTRFCTCFQHNVERLAWHAPATLAT